MSRDIFDDFEAAAHFSRRAAEAETLCRALMAAGLAAVEQARREEREACARIASDTLAEAMRRETAVLPIDVVHRIRARSM